MTYLQNRLCKISRIVLGFSLTLGLLSWQILPAVAGNLIKNIAFPTSASTAQTANVHSDKNYVARATNKSPLIDGLLNDNCWKVAPVIQDMLAFPATGKPPKVGTKCQISFDRQFIYVAIRADEPQMSKLKIMQMQDGAASIWNDDCIELWFDVQHSGNRSYHLIINPAGALYTQREQDTLVQDPLAIGAGVTTIHSQNDPSWKPQIQKAAKQGTDYWTVELRIPATALGLPQIIPGSVWGFNVARTRRAGGAGELSSWSGVYTSPITSFGTLQLGVPSVVFNITNPGNLAAGDNLFSLDIKNKGRQQKRISIKVLSGQQHPTEKLVVLKPQQNEVAALPYNIQSDSKFYKMEITAIDAQSRELLFQRSYSDKMPALLQLSLSSHQVYLGEEKTLKAEINYHVGDVSLKRYSLLLQLTHDHKPILSQHVSTLQGSQALVELDISDLHQEGNYYVNAILLNSQGKKMAEANDKFVTIDSPF